MESQAATVVTHDGPCPYCGEHVGPTAAPPGSCPFHAQPACPLLLSDSAQEMGREFEETVAYPNVPRSSKATNLPVRDESLVTDDGFPAADDLIDSDLGQYRIVEVIGRGSMGRVYRGEHRGLGRTSAIKVLSPGLVARQPRTVERFWAEARAVAGLIHANVVTVHNLGSDRGYHYIEMEFVPGGVSLKERVVKDGAFEPLRATVLVRSVAQALAAAHKSGLVHRDVKPANVLLTNEGQAKLADFGLVRKLTEVESAGGSLAGTPTFMAPELFSGSPPSPQSDMYAVGVMYYYLLTARLPFASDRLGELIRMHRRTPVPDPRPISPSVPDELIPILGRLLAKDPSARFDSAEELADELKVLAGHLRDTEGLVTEALDGLDCLIQHGGRDSFRVIMPVPGDRVQEVYVEVVEGRHHERLLKVYSVCAPADAANFEFALKLNDRLTHGSLSIREVHGAPMFVMTRSYSLGHVTAADIRASVVEIARRGDWVEQQLTQMDVF